MTKAVGHALVRVMLAAGMLASTAWTAGAQTSPAPAQTPTPAPAAEQPAPPVAVPAEAAKPAPMANPIPPSPEDPTAAKVYAIFDRHCARCHQAGKLDSKLPARRIGSILKLDTLARDPSLVRPGNPDASRVYTVLQSRQAPHDFPVDEIGGPELDAVRQWLLTVKPETTCPATNRISRAAVADAIRTAVAAKPAAADLRFITLTHLHNACATDTELQAYREGVGRLVNALSWGLEPIVLEPVDAEKTVLAVDIAKLGWTAKQWERLAAVYPYFDADGLRRELTSIDPDAKGLALRGDWLAAAAGRAPLYYDLLGLPDRLTTMLASLKIDPNAGVAQTRRVGVKTSAFIRGNRLIQRQPFANGAVWLTYDYATTPGRPDLFDAPGGPGTRGAPRPDSSLLHFNLPNGFQAFFMTNGEGLRLNELPASLVRDDIHASGRIIAGAACLACHDGKLQPAADELRARVQNDTAVPRDIRERLLALHVPREDMAKLYDEDGERLAKALAEAGLTPALTVDGLDPVIALQARFDRTISLAELARELDVPQSRITALATKTATGRAGDLFQRIIHGPVSRRAVEVAIPDLLTALGIEKKETDGAAPRTTDILAPEDPALQDDTREVTTRLVLKTGPATFKVGEALSVTVRSREACYLTLINIDRAGRGTVVYPNDFDQNNLLEAGKELKIPADGAPYQFRLRDAGRETVVGICLGGTKPPFGIKHDFERQRFTELGDYRAFLNRAAAADAQDRNGTATPDARTRPVARSKRGRAEPAPTPAPAAPARIEYQARNAIQVTVE